MPGIAPVPNVPPDALTPAELRLTKLLLAGCSFDEIASNMEITPQIVESLCDAVYEKLGTHDLKTLLRWANWYDVRRW